MRSTTLAMVMCFVATNTAAAPCPAAAYPGEEWEDVSAQRAGGRAEAIAALEETAFTLVGEPHERRGFRTNGLVIVQGGKIIYEKYARGFDVAKRHLQWSVTKSITSALVGVARHQGLLNLDDSLCAYLDGVEAAKCEVTLRQLLTFTSNIAYQEDYEFSSYQQSSIIAMLFGEGRKDNVAFTLTHRMGGPAGAAWRYKSGDAVLMAAIAKKTLEAAHGPDAFWSQLFEPIGIRAAVFEEDPKGNPQGATHAFMTPRDMARFGTLYLHDGCWAGRRLLPEGWVAESQQVPAVFAASAPEGSERANGYYWWLNQSVAGRFETPWPDAPADTYAALGHWGQYVIVIPSRDVVIVRTGDDRERDTLPVNDLVKRALEVAR